ncbi:MAG TPA: hypothetical protein VK762_15305 [Polyangiaceae bacterium]|nr:hypothetical protein [Polyangiaceae bacterium]
MFAKKGLCLLATQIASRPLYSEQTVRPAAKSAAFEHQRTGAGACLLQALGLPLLSPLQALMSPPPISGDAAERADSALLDLLLAGQGACDLPRPDSVAEVQVRIP